MLVLEALDIEKNYAQRVVLRIARLAVHTGDRIGIVGANGAGKTTLLSILAGELAPERGQVRRMCDFSYVRQFSEEADAANPEARGRLLSAREAHSGGEVVRQRLANAFSRVTPLLFCDEPTANLDESGCRVLREYLRKYETMLLISHDRALLDEECTKILHISDGAATLYEGNYTAFLQQRASARARAETEYERYLREKTHLTEAIENRSRRATRMRKAPTRMGNSEARLHRREATEREEKVHDAARALQSRLDHLEEKEKPKEEVRIRLDFSLTDPPRGQFALRGSSVTFGYPGKQLFQAADFALRTGKKTALCGANGAGKTTLLSLIRQGAPGITLPPKTKLGCFYQGFENLDPDASALANVLNGCVQPESVARAVLARLLITREDVGKNVSVLSGGEKLKCALAKLIVSGANVLLLDEPTNYLDIPALEAMQAVLEAYEGTVLFISHDRAFVDALADYVWTIENGKIIERVGNLSARMVSPPPDPTRDALRIQMRLSEIDALLLRRGADKEALEAEYFALAAQLRALPKPK